ncbi:unnamed protein product [Phaeothamnion confervicola]
MLSVSDATTGVCLYQRRWRWQDAKEPDGIGKLVMSFYQFARDLDDGEISCVNFEVSGQKHKRVASAHQSARRGRNVSKTSPPESVQMLSCANPAIIVAVFHEIKAITTTSCDNTASIRRFASGCRDSFSQLYGDKLAGELRPTLRRLADEATEGDLVALQRHFWTFEERVEELREVCFPGKWHA